MQEVRRFEGVRVLFTWAGSLLAGDGVFGTIPRYRLFKEGQDPGHPGLEERIPSLGFSYCIHRVMQKKVAGDQHDLQHLFQRICFRLFYILGFCSRFHLEKGYQLLKFIFENLCSIPWSRAVSMS